MERSSTTRSALFVDFDNIYLGLREDSPEAAEEFATAPARWLARLETGLPPSDGGSEEAARRSLLVRKCYLNPVSFGRYRPYFIRSGFSVVDCPPLTGRGKTSADILMVMDILDTLAHQTRFEEFMIMSGDADFTPVLLRLRTHDRRTMAMVGGSVAPAYRAAADLLISQEEFMEQALGIRDLPHAREGYEPPSGDVPESVLDAIAARVYREASTDGDLPAPSIPALYREFSEFTPDSNWLGFFSLRALTEAVVARRPDLRMADGDPWRVTVRSPEAAPAPVGADGAEVPPPPPPAAAMAVAGAGSRPLPAAARPGAGEVLMRRVVERVRQLVAEAEEPVPVQAASQTLLREIGLPLMESRWLGRGTFKRLLEGLGDDAGFTMVAAPAPGFLYDPERHEPPGDTAYGNGLSDLPPELAALIRRVHQVTGAPRLRPSEYHSLFSVMAVELEGAPEHLMGTGKAIRDQLIERGVTVSRPAVNFVLRGVSYADYPLRREGPHDAAELAEAFQSHVITGMVQAQADLSARERKLLDAWLLPPAEEPGAPPELGEDGAEDEAPAASDDEVAEVAAEAEPAGG